jgi:hypothetical protein
MLRLITQCVIILSVIMLSDIMLSAIMLSVIMLNVIMLSVVAPLLKVAKACLNKQGSQVMFVPNELLFR